MSRVYIETYGCVFNTSDSEAMAGVLSREGYEVVEREADADVVVLNSCTVKNRTYVDFRKRLQSLKAKTDPAIVVAGCVPKANPNEPLLEGVVQIGTNNLGDVAEAVSAALESKRFRRLNTEREDRIGLRGIRRNPAIEILPINHGCLSACTFCQTRIARGRLHSFPIDSIMQRARQALDEGVCEFRLTSQDTGAYGADIGHCLPDLLEALLGLEGDFRLRLGMSSPQWIRRDLKRLLPIFEDDQMYSFLHVPVQSGSDRVLEAMKRGHSAAEFSEVCEVFENEFPRMAIWTDLIVGFPEETDEDFEQTKNLVSRVRPAAINRSRFSPRPGTVAATLKQLPSGIIKDRSRQLNLLAEDISRQWLAQWIGWQGEVWVSEVAKPGSVVCRNHWYAPIAVKGEFAVGQRLNVRTTGATTYHLKGELL